MTTLGKIPSIMKHGILPGGDKGIRGSSFHPFRTLRQEIDVDVLVTICRRQVAIGVIFRDLVPLCYTFGIHSTQK